MVIVDRYRFLVEMFHERMDWVEKKIHSIMHHSPKDQLYYNQDNSLDLVDMQQSNLVNRLKIFSFKLKTYFRCH